MVEDALSLGVKHAALNLNLGQMPDLKKEAQNIPFQLDGKEYWFKRGYIEQLDQRIGALSSQGVIVSLILLVYSGPDPALNRILLHPNYDSAAPNKLGAFNTSSEEGRRYLRACMEFLAQRYSRSDQQFGRVWNYIVGNEVNSHWFWCNMGRVGMEEFTEDYLRAVRLVHQSVKKYLAQGRVYLSLEHHWGIRYPGGDEQQAFPGKDFLLRFAQLAKKGGDFDWHLAYHPYPENLFECRTWNDQSAIHSPDTPRITFKNLEVLTDFLRQPELLWDGRPRRVILSEQGFHTPDSPDGEELQAAAYCYAYYKVSQLDGIDSFILHRHVDHGREGGLKLGLWSRNEASSNPAEPLRKKKIYHVFQAADTPDWRSNFEFALPIIGISSWSELNPRP